MKRKGLTRALAVALSIAMVGTSVQPGSVVFANELQEAVTDTEEEAVALEETESEEQEENANEDEASLEESEEESDEEKSDEAKSDEEESKEESEEESEEALEESEKEALEEVDEAIEEVLTEEESWIIETAKEFGIEENTDSLKEDLETFLSKVNENDEEELEVALVELTEKYSINEDKFMELFDAFAEHFEWVIETIEVQEVEEAKETKSVKKIETGLSYKDFTEDKVVAEFDFGKDISKDSTYSEETGYGFSKVEFPNAAKGWSGNIYYPREAAITSSDASYVEEAKDSLKISSKVWTETESTGYGVYTYENTATFDIDLDSADYEVEVTFVNPTNNSYSAYVEAEDITKVTGIEVAAGASKTVSFLSCLVDKKLNLKFLGTSGATSESGAGTQDVYVSNVKITRKATNAPYENNGVKKPTVFLASDSTVQSYESHYYPQTGWGQVLAEFFGDGNYDEVTSKNAGYSQSKTYETSTVVVENRAIGGRSSSSFILEGKLDDLLEDVAPGDYLLIQWGHNDATYSRPNRYVSSADFEKWMQYYVDGAIQRGATPILVTPVARYSYTTDSDGNLISYASNFEAYRQVMAKMSKEQGIALVDLTGRSIDLANDFGIDGGKSLWLHVNAGDYTGAYAGGATDSTHLQWYGAFKFAQCVAKGITEAGSSDYDLEKNISSENKEALKKLATEINLQAAAKAPGKVSGLTEGTVGSSSVAMNWSADDESELYYIYRAKVDSEEEAKNYQFDKDAKKYSVSRSNKYQDSACLSGAVYVYAVRGFNSLGLGEFSENIVVTTKSAGLRFDFNYNDSKTQLGWIGIKQNQMYDKEVGYGWSIAPGNGRSRGNNGTVSDDLADMAGDFCLGAGTFSVDLPNGDYEITVYAADLLSGTSTIKPSYEAEGESIGGIACRQSLGSVTAQVRVTDGQLNLKVTGTNQYINGLTVTELLLAPTALVETEASVTDNNYSFLIGFNGVKEAAGYNVYRKGTTDADFAKVKTFTVEEYAADELSCRAMAANLGENYEYYVTCYTADGTESAPSNTITVEALLKSVNAPAAPKNVVCVDPSEDATKVQNTITISWDKAEVTDSKYPVLKYIVYRSDRAEDEKGFVEFKKIGETKETSFTDTDEDIATNVHYYYKVCASNAGGAGELSEVCKTPVTGELAKESQEELTDRALVAIALSDSVKGYSTSGEEITSGVYLSWRAFEEEFNSKNKLTTTFDVYCNGKQIANDISVTNMVYEGGKAGDTFKVVGSQDSKVNGGLIVKTVKAHDNQYIEYELNKPADQTMPNGDSTSFTANDMSVGDVDGDGVLELIVKWYPGNAQDNSKGGYTGTTILDTYDIDWASSKVTLLSRIDLGVNIRSGAHYTQFQVWDFDGDGKAEVAVKTADGSTSYDGSLKEVAHVGEVSAAALPTDKVSEKYDYRNSGGYVLSGPEYFSIFNLEDGTKAADDVDYIPARGNVSAWGDAYGNRVDRFLSATAYLDGVHAFAVMCRGYYTRTALTAYGMKDTDNDGIGDTIFTYWSYDTNNGDGPEGQGNHNLSVADVDKDGKDEIIYGSSCYDHDGTLKYSTGMGHGDAMHVSDWISWNDGLEVMEVHEEWNQKYQVEIHDAETGEVLVGYPVSNADVGRGVAADIDPRYENAEFWASSAADGSGSGEWDSIDSAVYSAENSSTTYWDVVSAGSTPAVNAMLYWDGDLLAEVQDHKFNNKNGNYYPISVVISDWDYESGKMVTLIDSTEILSINGTKGNLGLIADLTGDWREEFIARCSADDSHVRVYNTTYVTDYVVPCLLDDLQYREGVAWENVAYNQPAHTSYLLSKGLVTAKVSVSETSASSVTLSFTAANDGELYGHDITAYEIYRDGKLIDTVDVKKLATASSSSNEEAPLVEPVKPKKLEYKFDFGAGDVAEGYTQVTSKDIYSEEKGYGFADLNTAGNSTFASGLDNTALYDDSVLFYDKSASSKEFKIDLPNGTYEVTYSIAGSNIYNAVTAEGTSIEAGKFRFGKAGGSNTITAEVTVEDGQLNFVNTISKNGYFNIVFTAIEVSELSDAYAEKLAKYETAKEAYDKAVAQKEAANEAAKEETTVDVKKADYKFDFGAGAVAEGYTQVKADSLYNEETGYGFTSTTGLSNKAYKNWNDDEKAALFNDSVLGWIANGSSEFVVDLPNGTYEVSYTIANGSGAVYDAVKAEDVSFADVRRGNADIQATSQTVTVEVTDGQLNIVNTVSKNGYAALYFTAIEITETADSYDARVEKAIEEKKSEESASVDTNGSYVYVDKNVSSNTSYTYKIAAVVDGKTSYMSLETKAKTLVNVSKVENIVLDDIYENTDYKDSVAELLPATVTVIDENGEKQSANVTWDVTELNIDVPGEYTVYAFIAGFSEKITCTVKVLANEVTGIADIDTIRAIAGTDVSLPATVKVQFSNGKEKEVAVAWNTTKLDNNTIGDYELTGTVEGYNAEAKALVKIVSDYPVSVDTTTIEVAVGDTIVKNLPATVVAKMGSGKETAIKVTWKTENVDNIDTSVESDQIIHGSVENLDADVLCNVNVRYKALYKFDFGINGSLVESGWTGVTVNSKGGKKTASTLGIEYTAEKGYGFLDPNAVIEGRTESVTGNSVYPNKFVTDFALTTGQTFVVDVPNGEYAVEAITSCGIGSSSMTVEIEGTSTSLSTNKSYTVSTVKVTVEDGQLTIIDKSSLARCAGYVIRQISVEETLKVVNENGAYYITKGSDKLVNTGLEFVDGKYYYVSADGKLLTNKFDKKVTLVGETVENPELFKNGYYWFTEDGSMYMEPGFVRVNQKNGSYILKNGAILKDTGMEKVDGCYHYVSKNGTLVKNTFGFKATKIGETIDNPSKYLNKTYFFDGNCVMIVPFETYVYTTWDGRKYILKNGLTVKDTGLEYLDGNYYYTQKYGQLVTDVTNFKISKVAKSVTNPSQFKNKTFDFGSDGKMIIK